MEIKIDVPQEFIDFAAHFGFTPEYLAGLLLIDFCVRAPSCLWVVSDDPSISREHEESDVVV